MASSSHTQVKAKNGQQELTAQHIASDAPLLPMNDIERLREIAPDRVPWVFEQTEIEGNFRRSELKRVNSLSFARIVLGLLFGLLIGVFGIGASVYLALQDKTVVASILGGSTVLGLVALFITGKAQGK